MRLIFVAIIILDIAVLFMGAFFIFDKIMRKRRRKRELHYTFCPFEKETKRGYALYNDEGRYIFYAINEEEVDNCSVYSFKNSVTKRKTMHKVSEMLRNKNAPNFSKKTFYFDDKEIWKLLDSRGISIRATVVDDSLTQYKIEKYSETIAFIRKRKGSGRVYTMRTYDKDVNLLFLVLFAIAKTEEKTVDKSEEKPVNKTEDKPEEKPESKTEENEDNKEDNKKEEPNA